MEGFVELLKYSNPALAADDDDTEPSLISVMQAEVVDNLALYMSKYEEEFQPYLSTCLGHAWELLVSTSLFVHHDLLVTTSIRFLTTVSTSVHHQLFAQAEVLQNVCEKIIAPNMQLLAADEEIFDENPIEYVRRDIEGSDSDTRRRVSCDLVRGLCKNYEAQVTALFQGYISTLLAQYSATPATGWKAKDVAIYLVIALTIKGGTSKLGATQTNQLVNLVDFFSKNVLPELQSAAASVSAGGAGAPHPVLIADAIKFVSTFRVQLDVDVYVSIMPHLIALLAHRNHVVHTYAASAIERMLTVKDAALPGTPSSRRFKAAQLIPLLQQLLTSLFAILNKGGSEDNAYAMRAIMRVTVVAGEAMAPYANVCITSLNGILGRVCANPSNPTFNHFLFETVASLVRYICAATPTAVDSFEQLLFPPFQTVLQMDISEFTPYVFQVLAQLLECRTGVSPAYESLFAPLLTPSMWERPGNIPPLVRLICAYMAKGKALVLGKLQGVLGVFQKLLASKATDAYACRLLSAIWTYFEQAEVAQFVTPIFNLCLTRLQSNKKVGPQLISAWATYVARYGPAALRATFESIQPGLTAMILGRVWAEHSVGVSGALARKTVAISSVRLLTDSAELLASPEAFAAVLQAVVAMLLADAGVSTKPTEDADEEAEDAPPDVDGGGGYSAAYVQLSFAANSETDLYASEVPSRFFASGLTQLNAAQPGPLGALMGQLPQEKQQQIQGLMQLAQS